MLKCRMSFSYSKTLDNWLEETAAETGATKAGVLRLIALNAMYRAETKKGKVVTPKEKKCQES